MKKPTSLNALFAAAIVALLPSFASANLILFPGTVPVGQSVDNPFQVTTAGTFDFFTASSFLHLAVLSAGGSTIDSGGPALVSSFSEALGLGTYLFRVSNVSSPSGVNVFLAGIHSTSGVTTNYVTTTTIPEPSTLMLLGAGLLGLGLLLRRRAAS